MEKMSQHDPATRSADIVSENIDSLKALFPEAFTEGKIDFEALRQLLGDNIEEGEEKYALNWHGKRRARQLALTPSTGTLRPCPEESLNWDTSQNVVIEGDNLEALKLLQRSYAGKIKFIYIDPPYNKGKDYVYPDDFRESIQNYKMLTGQMASDGRKLTSNTESNGRFHTDWLNMMYPRLRLARNLMREDGVILISIDDDEAHNLKAICTEIFGEENFVASLIWEKGRKNDAQLISVGHEYIHIFAKNKAYFSANKIKWREAKPGAKEILNEYLRLREIHGANNSEIETGIKAFYESLPKSHPSKRHSRYNKVDDRGVWRDDNMSWPGGGGPDYDVIHPTTGEKCVVPEGGWRYSTVEKMNEMISLGKVVFRDDHTEPPIRKTYLVEVDVVDDATDDFEMEDESDDLPIQVAGSYFYRSALQASNELTALFGKKVFNNPKDHEVISRWISYVKTGPDDIVLDFFAGSGTTAHAVLQQNLEEPNTMRYILVQLPEPIDPKTKGAKPAVSFLQSLGKPVNIAELTKERLRRVAQKLKSEHPDYEGDLGFRVFKLDSSNIQAWNPSPNDLEQTLLDHLEHLVPDRREADILCELLLKLGLSLTVPIEQKSIAGKIVYSVGAGALMVCLADIIDRTTVESLAVGIVRWHEELRPAVDTRMVFRDSAFADDVAKSNITAILQQHGLDDVRSV